jgi:hypothetical protein
MGINELGKLLEAEFEEITNSLHRYVFMKWK